MSSKFIKFISCGLAILFIFFAVLLVVNSYLYLKYNARTQNIQDIKK